MARIALALLRQAILKTSLGWQSAQVAVPTEILCRPSGLFFRFRVIIEIGLPLQL
jgi:hypothetical protein